MTKFEGRQVFTTTAWAVEIDGEVRTNSVFRTREAAREMQSIYKNAGMGKTARVRKVEVRVVPGR